MSLHEIETRIAMLQNEMRDIWSVLRGVRPGTTDQITVHTGPCAVEQTTALRFLRLAAIVRGAQDARDDDDAVFKLAQSHRDAFTRERPTEPELEPARVATVERKVGPPAIARLVRFAEAWSLDGPNGCGCCASMHCNCGDGLPFSDFNARHHELTAAIEGAKAEDAELQHLRRVAEAVGEYFVAERMRDGARMAVAKNRVADLMAAWRNPARPT